MRASCNTTEAERQKWEINAKVSQVGILLSFKRCFKPV